MDIGVMKSVRSADYERRIHVRPNIGATASVQQRSRLRFAHLSISQPSITVIVKGEKTLQYQDETTTITTGQAIALDHGVYEITNRPASDGVFEAFWLAWDAAHTTDFTNRTRQRQAGCPQRLLYIEPDFQAALTGARHALMTDSIPASVARHRMEEVLWWLHEKGVTFDIRPNPSLVLRLEQLLGGQPAHGWTLADAADHLAIGQATLRRRLAAEGKTFSDTLIDTRMSLALTMLQCTDQSVNQIALDVGYESASRFAVRFRKRFGFAPSEVRGHSR